MPTYPFALVDVFAGRALEGNPLAVVGDADLLDESTMRRAAVEFRQSETTFVMTSREAGVSYRLRSFTPTGEEVVGAGHNSLGAWWWLAETGRLPLHAGSNDFHQEIGDRVLPLSIDVAAGNPVGVALQQTAGTIGASVGRHDALAAALGITTRDLGADARVVSTGVGHLLVEVGSTSILDRLAPDSKALRALLADADGQGCYVWTRGSKPQEAFARFFNPTVGIHEDSATGSAAGPLAALLVHLDPTLAGETLAIEQGQAMGRPSRLELIVDGTGVRLMGSCVTSVTGSLELSESGPERGRT